MATDNGTSKFLTVTKIAQACLIFAVLVYAVILYVVIPRIDIGVLHGDPLLITMAQVFGVISVIILAAGFLMPWLVSKMPQPDTNMLFAAYIGRLVLFIAVGVFGCFLGTLGAEWQITLPFIVAAGLSLIITFPTGKKWGKGF
jgi:hypothetical protein